ncbi:IclR family transcriptional regulator [Ruminiclostridium sufflavum DSM 19573]|uniref:IclR family transcriptional regulator n=1 Tax=Ruminiclostridium sufflavum DSM 19573 TaxID=1121337 RepID=A0A318Y3Z3_9FIRM|nr:IclR family transcriptional regulator [Ruminiclostridium sufflavum]PYG90308.1 IclR family transcriptional regulator [Ruminiclostridium sufflavum DSM 19573]
MQIIDRTLKALTFLSNEPTGLSVSELSTMLGIPASSTHRILTGLKENHFIIQDGDTKKYKVSYKLFTLCSQITKNSSLVSSAKSVMKKLAKKLDKTIVLCVMENSHIICIDYIENKDTSMYMVKIGYEMPLHVTSAGKVFSAFMDRKAAEQELSKTSMEAATPYTKTSLEELYRELDEIKKDGYAICDEELQLGIQGIACPIFDMNNNVVATISFAALKREHYITEKTISELKSSASEISRLIG